MKHYGDITKINGADAPVVDIITGGSPCQDLSVAGKRAGLAGERSGLFMEQIRIVKEMRERERATGRTGWMVRPRYMVWENVPGAFSSGNPKGADFAAVIEEIIKVAEPGTAVSVCIPNGGWTKSGCYYAKDGSWSIAWRVHDAQFWGVPQRRKRIALVADFGGLSAPEILFERKGLSGDSEPCGAQREEAAATVEGSADGAEYFGLDQQGGKGGANYTIGVAPTLAGDSHGTPHGVAYGISSYDSNAMKSSNPHSGIYEADTARTLCLWKSWDGSEISPTLTSNNAGGNQRMPDKDNFNAVVSVAHSLKAKANLQFRENSETYIPMKTAVRRLTPLECERLQGYPDGWTDIGEWTDSKGKKHGEADSPRYKALGNSIALPFWQWMARRICAQYERTVTMASLFDGIGGFPLVFQRCGAVPVWASEIEEFPIAVTKVRFPDESV